MRPTASSSSASSSSSLLLSDAERDFIRDGIMLDCRVDGRRRLDVRRYAVQTGGNGNGIFPLSHGSAEIYKCCRASVSAELVVAFAPCIVVEWQQRRLGFMEEYLLAQLYDHLTVSSTRRHTTTAAATAVYWKLTVDVITNVDEDGLPACSLETIAQCVKFALLDTRLPVLAIQGDEDDDDDEKKMVDQSSLKNNNRSGGDAKKKQSSSSMIDRITLVPDETRRLVDDEDDTFFSLTLVSVYELSTSTSGRSNNNNNLFFLDADAAERAVSTVTHVVLTTTTTNAGGSSDDDASATVVVHCQGNPAAVPVALSARAWIDRQYQRGDQSKVLLIR